MPIRSTQNLRLGAGLPTREAATHFQFPDDTASFAQRRERCFGVGKCRALIGQTMCPSFQATREEMHSTRGRAHLLFEMLRGDSDQGRLARSSTCARRSICACNARAASTIARSRWTWRPTRRNSCRTITQGRLRPRAAYAMGLVFLWSRLARLAPGFVNAALATAAVARAGGFAPQREPPEFAAETFQEWCASGRAEGRDDRKPVILWPDTFNNHFLPGTAQSGGQGAGECRLSRHRAASAAVLRPAALRLRNARFGETQASGGA